MTFCTQCGTNIPDNAKFCPSCGSSLTASDVGGAQSHSDPKMGQNTSSGISDGQASPYVGFGKRFVAHLVDLIIVFIIFYVIGMQVAENVGGVTDEGFALEGTPAVVVMALSFFASLLYFMLTEGRGGQSFGKMVMGIKVVSTDGSACSMRQAFIRNFLRIIDGFFFYLIGIILMMRSDRKQRLGDRIAETVVIRKTKAVQGDAYVYRSGDKKAPDPEQDGKAKFRSSWGVKKGRDAWDV
ncbi:RDD family protein [uncultured Cohaesibacter sp.]|uniref:RDD family protein n=1 Tax=uncultured Cohaesibacter sp. TaxID=1002546 RepID=UPI00293073F3|nr:RDD family protein [uncultured Cohaesibacter sp.]